MKIYACCICHAYDSDKKMVLVGPEEVTELSPCSECQGEGEVECMYCEGSGEENCAACRGKGTLVCGCECPECGGGGKIECGCTEGNLECECCEGEGYLPTPSDITFEDNRIVSFEYDGWVKLTGIDLDIGEYIELATK